MPEHNLIQRPDLILRLQQFFGIRQAHVAPTLGDHIQPVVIVADVRDPGGLIEVEPVFSDVIVEPGNAANGSTISLGNPLGSGVVVLPLWVGVTCNPLAVVHAQLEPGASALFVTGTSWADGGQTRGAKATLISQSAIPGVGIPGVFELTNQSPTANGSGWFPLKGLVLPPDRKLTLYSSVINTAMSATFIWTERSQVPGVRV